LSLVSTAIPIGLQFDCVANFCEEFAYQFSAIVEWRSNRCRDHRLQLTEVEHEKLVKFACWCSMKLAALNQKQFLPRDAMHKRGLCRRAVNVHP